ncbi:MAG: repressor LexA, partial [Microcystis aeruginosa]
MTNLESLTQAQQELYDWLIEYIRTTQHAPSIRQMMRAMNLRSPAPIQSRLERLRTKGYIDWTEGKARTLR